MELDATLAVARLVAEIGPVKGRKRLQKIVHLLQSKGYDRFHQRFILHYFGPFSRQLAAQLDFVCAAHLVEQIHSEGVYTYQTPPDCAEEVFALLSDVNEPPPWISFAKLLADNDTPFLEALSTLVFLSRAGVERAKLQQQFEHVKPGLKRWFAEASEFATTNELVK